jgi:phage shock protein PspC (stress-responsive transcriptional regulator)
MTTSNKTYNTSSKDKAHFAEFDDQVLQKTFEEFYTDNQEDTKTSIWNFSTIAGLGVVGVSLLFVFQAVLTMVFGTEPFGIVDPDFLGVLPIISGITATIIGLGWFRRNKGKKKLSRAQKKALKNAQQAGVNASYQQANFQSNPFSSSQQKASSDPSSSETRNYPNFNRGVGTNSSSYERYAISKNNRLFKSRRDKVVSGVLGGIAKYVGIKPGILRLLFIFTLFMSFGVSLFVYIILSLVLPKEPIILLDD